MIVIELEGIDQTYVFLLLALVRHRKVLQQMSCIQI